MFHFDRFGLFWYGTEPTIFLVDLDLIKKVQITDHDHFTDFGQSQSQFTKTDFNQNLAGFFPAVLQNKGVNAFGLVDMKGEDWKKTKR